MGRRESPKLQKGKLPSPGRGNESPQDRLDGSLEEMDVEVVVATKLRMSHRDVLAAKTPREKGWQLVKGLSAMNLQPGEWGSKSCFEKSDGRRRVIPENWLFHQC